jgi:hypothetical protein
MPKPRRTDRPVEKSINLPQTLCAQVDLLLYSELEGRVPFGAWSKLIEQLLKSHVDKLSAAGARHARPI